MLTGIRFRGAFVGGAHHPLTGAHDVEGYRKLVVVQVLRVLNCNARAESSTRRRQGEALPHPGQ